MSPVVPKNIHWCDSNSGRPFDSLVSCDIVGESRKSSLLWPMLMLIVRQRPLEDAVITSVNGKIRWSRWKSKKVRVWTQENAYLHNIWSQASPQILVHLPQSSSHLVKGLNLLRLKLSLSCLNLKKCLFAFDSQHQHNNTSEASGVTRPHHGTTCYLEIRASFESDGARTVFILSVTYSIERVY